MYETSVFHKIDNYAFIKGDVDTIHDFLDSLNDEARSTVEIVHLKNDLENTTLKITNKDEGLFQELLFLAEDEFHLFIEYPMNLNKRITEGFMDPVPATKMQKKVDEVNALIAAAIDSDNDPLDVIDSSSTWQAPMQFSPFIFKNGYLYSQYKEMGHKGWEVKKERYKPTDSYDAYQWLNQVAKWYRTAIKKSGKVITNFDALLQNKGGGYKQGELPTIQPNPGPPKTFPPHDNNN